MAYLTARHAKWDQARPQQIGRGTLVMLRSIFFDVAFLSLGGALLISIINVQAGLVSLTIGIPLRSRP